MPIYNGDKQRCPWGRAISAEAGSQTSTGHVHHNFPSQLQRDIKELHDIHKEMSVLVVHLLLNEIDPEHLSFDAITAAEPEYLDNAGNQFYTMVPTAI